MKTYGGVEVKLHTFLTLELGVCELPTSRFSNYCLGERASITDWIGSRVGPRFGLDMVMAKKKFPTRARNFILIVQPVV
jgi:hypothetical protein